MNTTRGKRIAEARRKKGLTQSELAKLLGVHRVTVAKWERGEQLPFRNYKELASALGVDVLALLGDDNEPFDEVIKRHPDPFQHMADEKGVDRDKVIAVYKLIKMALDEKPPKQPSLEPSAGGAESVLRNIVLKMPIYKQPPIPHGGTAAADEQDSRVWENVVEPGLMLELDALEPRVVTVRGASAEEVARDGQQAVVDTAHINVGVGELCIVLTKDGLLRLKRKGKDRGRLRVYQSINRDYPPFEVNAHEVIAEFPVVTILIRPPGRSPVETVDEGVPT